MQIPLPKIALALTALLSLAVTGVRAEDKTAAATKSATFKLTGMTCGSCEAALKEATTKVDGVKSTDASAAKGTVVVAYDPTKTTEAKIAAAINATEYKIAK